MSINLNKVANLNPVKIDISKNLFQKLWIRLFSNVFTYEDKYNIAKRQLCKQGRKA